MKRRIITTLLVGILLSFNASARIGGEKAPKSVANTSYKTESGDCRIPVSQAELNINNVRCRLLAAGDLWWDFDKAKYEVPKGDGNPGIHAIFAGAIWISGRDAAGNLKLAAQRFRQGNSDFYSGPLDNSGNIDLATCQLWDKHFSVLGSDIARLQAAFKAGNLSAADVPSSIALWPGKGNTALTQRGFNMNQNLAPFFDANLDGIYNPIDGDYPVIKQDNEAFADQMVFWVINDKGNTHTETSSQPMSIQINALAFAFQTTDEINNMTFYTYNIVNKSGANINQTYMSQFVDGDLGCYNDDRIGCDTSRSLGIYYNSRAVDPDGCNSGTLGYGSDIPMLGFDFFEGPIDTGGKELGLTRFNYFNNGASGPQTDPQSFVQYRSYQEGFWKDGSIFSFGGNGYGGSVPTKFCYPGDPSNASQWSECNPQSGAAIPGDDRRILLTSGPFTFLANATQRITIGVVFVRPQGGVGVCPSFKNFIGVADDKAQALFNSGFKLVDGPPAPTLKIRELDKTVIINLINEFGSKNYAESYNDTDQVLLTQTGFIPGVSDPTYTFQGYKIYQLADQSVSATDLENLEKARLVGRFDVKDGLTRFINYEKDAILGLLIPKLKESSLDNGIQHSLKVTKDYFTNNDLINHKTYYYAAIAYATNNFKEYDPLNPGSGGQLTQYLQGRLNFNQYSAIPHISDPRNEGTQLGLNWGDAVEVKRIGGRGNGGNEVDLTKGTIDKIMSGSPYKRDTLVYKVGFDPLDFKVTDPIALKEADFMLKIKDTIFGSLPLSNAAWWELTDLTNNKVIRSERNIEVPYEQFIIASNPTEDYGFSLSLGKPTLRYTNLSNNSPVYGAISGSITFDNPNDKWLSFIQDGGVQTASNWIRSGTFRLRTGSNDPLAEVFDDNYYLVGGTDYQTDPEKLFEKIANGTWAPYCLAANYHLLGIPGNATTPVAVYAPGFKWDKYGTQIPPENTLNRLQSVDIVLTSDKSKWSQCVVFETGEEEGTNQGANIAKNGRNARKGQIRMAYSKNQDGTTLFSDPVAGIEDTGRSWFPGYAVNVETGERLNIAFGEASEWGNQNGRDMLWNPTNTDFDDLDLGGTIPKLPYFGGKHFIYVMETSYDGGKAMQDTLLKYYDRISTNPNISYPTAYRDLYRQIMYTSIPYLSKGATLKSISDGVIPNDVTVKIRVEKPFGVFNTPSALDTPTYLFSTKGAGPKQQSKEVAKTALDLIRVVPNPYLAYSAYETAASDNRVKITNLPNECVINIYTLDGTLVKSIRRSVGINQVDPITQKVIEISDGNNETKTPNSNIDNSAEWDLKNEKNVPVSSGIYLFEINAPGIGHKILKWFGTMRPADVSNF